MLQNNQIKGLVSVIIPTYNYDLTRLARAIQSVYEQTYRPIEIVICDDGSAIPLAHKKNDLLGEITAKEPAINLIFTANEANEGISAARNKAVSAAKGEWLVWLDDDDTLDSDCIRQLLNHSKNKTMVIGECDVNEGGEIMRRKPKPYFEAAKQHFRTEQDPFLLNIISIQPQLVSRTTFDQMGGFSQAFPYAELTEFFLRYLTQFGLEELDFIEGAIYNYDRTREGTITSDRKTLFTYREKALNAYKSNLLINKQIIYVRRNQNTGMQEYKLKK